MEIKKSLIPDGRPNRPGSKNNIKYITIHETGNFAVGADARAHSVYLRTTSNKVSWHYSVDEEQIYQHLPDNEVAYHTGTVSGNTTSIGIEICVNSDGNFNIACTNTVELVRMLMKKYSIPIENVVQHNFWNGKNCPANLRLGGWDEFIAKCAKKEPDNTPSAWATQAWNAAVSKNITDGTRPHENCTREEVITMLYRAGVLSK